MESIKLVEQIVKALDEKKGMDIKCWTSMRRRALPIIL